MSTTCPVPHLSTELRPVQQTTIRYLSPAHSQYCTLHSHRNHDQRKLSQCRTPHQYRTSEKDRHTLSQYRTATINGYRHTLSQYRTAITNGYRHTLSQYRTATTNGYRHTLSQHRTSRLLLFSSGPDLQVRVDDALGLVLVPPYAPSVPGMA
eukprot:1914637-Rhodomonas_salina.1